MPLPYCKTSTHGSPVQQAVVFVGPVLGAHVSFGGTTVFRSLLVMFVPEKVWFLPEVASAQVI